MHAGLQTGSQGLYAVHETQCGRSGGWLGLARPFRARHAFLYDLSSSS